jgi:hypothetical protein
MYEQIPGRPLEYATTILACIAVLVTIPIYIVYWKGPEIRKRSNFAQSLEKNWEKSQEKRRKGSVQLRHEEEKVHQERV